jgi:hypothetical protein
MFFRYHRIAQTLLPPDRMGSFFKKVDLCQIFDYSGLGGSSFPCEQIWAQGVAAAHFVALVRE